MSKRKAQNPILPMLFSDADARLRTLPSDESSAVRGQSKAEKSAAGDKKTKPSSKLPSYIEGHRKRLREKFSDFGPQAFADYELLEFFLFLTNKRRDVKPLAHRLLKEFADINHVICASPTRLSQIEGVGEATITSLKLVETICQRMLKSKLLSRPVISSWDALLAYCQAIMAYRDKEVFSVLYLDNRNMLIRDEILTYGTVNHVPVYPREVASRALELSATAVILVHNHPSGDHSPSQDDIEMTRAIENALTALDITLHDHLVISKSGETSFRAQGYLSGKGITKD